MIRLALIGCGAWGWRYIPSALAAGNCKVTHVARLSATASLTARGAAQYLSDIHVASDWRALLEAPVDAFVVATPPSTHEEICVELLDRCLPVMVEKPMALEDRSAQRIAKAAWSANVPFLVSHQHLFATAYEALRARSLAWAECTVVSCGSGPGPVRDYSALWDYGPHDVAMFLGLAPGADALRVTPISRTEHDFNFRIDAGDRRGFVTVSNNDRKRRSLMATSNRGEVLVYDDTRPPDEKLCWNGVPVRETYEAPLTRAVRAFAEAIRTGEADWRFDPNLSVDVTRILESASTWARPGMGS